MTDKAQESPLRDLTIDELVERVDGVDGSSGMWTVLIDGLAEAGVRTVAQLIVHRDDALFASFGPLELGARYRLSRLLDFLAIRGERTVDAPPASDRWLIDRWLRRSGGWCGSFELDQSYALYLDGGGRPEWTAFGPVPRGSADLRLVVDTDGRLVGARRWRVGLEPAALAAAVTGLGQMIASFLSFTGEPIEVEFEHHQFQAAEGQRWWGEPATRWFVTDTRWHSHWSVHAEPRAAIADLSTRIASALLRHRDDDNVAAIQRQPRADDGFDSADRSFLQARAAAIPTSGPSHTRSTPDRPEEPG